jgi:hypothetical protein
MEILLDNIEHLDDMTLYHLRSDNDGFRNFEDEPILPYHPNIFIVNVDQFKMHGMYDEDFAGHYGYEEIYMTRHWEHEGGKRLLFADYTYFNNLGFSSVGLDRDSSHNKMLGENKVLDGTKNSVGILRFEWKRQTVISKPKYDAEPSGHESLMHLSHGTDIYAGFVPTFAVDRQSWSSEYQAFDDIIGEVRPSIVIDVGVWKGDSTIYLAELLRKHSVNGTVIAIDTFLGSAEHWDRESPVFGLIPRSHGTPLLYEQFLSNVVRLGVSDRVVPLRLTSTGASILLGRLGIQAGLIHIDASHEYEDVLRDARSYWHVLAPGGYLIGDDYSQAWPGVIKAVDEFAAEKGTPLSLRFPKWLIKKPL